MVGLLFLLKSMVSYTLDFFSTCLVRRLNAVFNGPCQTL